MTQRLLITARHPGPADALLGAIPELAKNAEIHLVATDSALSIFLDRGFSLVRSHVKAVWTHTGSGFVELDFSTLPGVLPASQFSSTQLEVNDLNGASSLLVELQQLFSVLTPDIFLRTTPASGIGIDELAPTALRNCGYNGLIYCFQDYYGVGLALCDNEHSVARIGVDAIATVDEAAARSMNQRTCIRTVSIGWISFEKYLTGVTYPESRLSGRKILELPDHARLLLYAGICSGLPDRNDVHDFEKCLVGLASYSDQHPELMVALRTHPRCSPEEQQEYKELCTAYVGRIHFQSLEAIKDFRQVLAVPDIFLSPASAINLDALAYAASAQSFETQSIYTTGEYARAALYSLTGPELPPTHERGNGSFVTDYEILPSVLDEALFSTSARQAVSARAQALYGTDGSSLNRLSQFLGLATK